MTYKTTETIDPKLAPPQDVDAEQQVLGAVLKDEKALSSVLDFLNSDDYFYVPKHRYIYKAILNLNDANEPCDIFTVAAELVKLGLLDQVGGRSYLTELVEAIVTTANIVTHANIVFEKALLRKLIETSNHIVKDCYNLKDDVTKLLDNAEQNIFSLSEKRLRTEFVPLGKLVPETFDEIEKYQQTKGGMLGLETGFDKLDAITSGLHEANMIVIAGRPSMGKTAIALNIAENVALEKNTPVGIFSIEMSKEQLALRLLCGRARVSQHLLRTERLKDSEWQKLLMSVDRLREAPIYIDDSPTLSPLEMRAKGRRLKAKHDVGLIIIDYVQMMQASGRVENRQQEIAMISRSIKGLAKELNIPVVACSQLSRMVETRGGDKRPQLSDLRESGAIEQDADVVMFVYRPEFYLSHLDRDDPKRMEVEGLAEIIVAKQRNGPTGKIDLAFVKEFARFENRALSFQEKDQPF